MDNSNLLLLVKSLKKNEMQHVTHYLSKHKKDSNLLKLCQIIRNDSLINNADIAKKINDKKFVSRLNQNKFELYQLILDALHQFDLRKSPYARILTLLHQSEILLNKGLMEARLELLLKAGQLADENELLELKLEIVRLRIGDLGLLKETQELTGKIIENAHLKHLHLRHIIFQNKIGDRPTLTQKKYSGKLLHAFKKKSTRQDSFYNKYIDFAFLMSYYRTSGEFNEVYIYGMKVLKLFKQHPYMLRIQLWRLHYYYALSNLLIASFKVSKNETWELVYNEIMNLDVSAIHKNGVVINMLDSYIQSGEFKKGSTFLNNIQAHLPTFYNFKDTLIFYFNLAEMNFGLGIYSKALFWLNEILNNSKKQLEDFSYTGITRLVRLITYYELKKFDVLEYEIRSTSHYIEKRGSHFKMDQLIMYYLLKMIVTNDKTELRKVMEEARNKLLQLTKIKTEAGTLEIFDFISWLDSKIENRTFAEVVREKAKKRMR